MTLQKIPTGVKFPLYEGVKLINAAIEEAEKSREESSSALAISSQANDTANAAEQKADSVQAQFNQVVIEGDSSVEAAQARVAADGTTFMTLQERLNQSDAHLADLGTQKADKSELQQISLSYKESYTDLTSLQTAYPTGDAYNHVVLSDGMIYTWNGSAWVSTQIQANGTGIADGTITESKTTFIERVKSANLFDKNNPNNVDNSYINVSTGAIVASSSLGYSHLIPIVNGETYKYPVYYNSFGASSNRMPLYNSSGTYIGYATGTLTADNLFNIATVNNVNAKFVRVNYSISPSFSPRKEAFMFAKNSEYPTSYEEFIDTFKLSNGLVKEQEVIDIFNNNPVETKSKLFGKVATFNGDSISNGSSAGDGLSGWAGRIGTKNSMTWENRSVGGGTIATETYASDGTTPRHWISRDIANMRSDADYIILEGGTNDADILGEGGIGTISAGYTATLDETTFTGALESTFKQAILKYPGKKIGYIIPHKMGSYGNSITNNRRAFFDRAIEVCEKWGIPYIDLWKSVYFNSDVTEIRTAYYSDSQHLNSLGYEVITPRIQAWMESL